MTTDKKISLNSVRPVHPGRGVPSYIEMTVALDYLNNRPVARIVLTHDEAIRLIYRTAEALAIVYGGGRD